VVSIKQANMIFLFSCPETYKIPNLPFKNPAESTIVLTETGKIIIAVTRAATVHATSPAS
jgi:hypothetical protein